MKIFFVQSYSGEDVLTVYPLGLVCLASHLTGHEVRILDLNLCDEPYDELKKELTGFHPDVVGISLRNVDNHNRVNPSCYYREFRDTVEKIKEIRPDLPLIAGGAGFSMYAPEIMERNPTIDFGVYLEGEESLPELLAKLDDPQSVKGIYYRKDGKVAFTGGRALPELGALGMPRREFADVSRYAANRRSVGVQSKRGCPLECSHCNYPFLNGKKVRVKPPKDVVDEIEVMVNKHGIDEFMFVDPVFNVPREHAEGICHQLLRRSIKVKWGAFFDIRYADEDFLLLAGDAGCMDFMFSPDAASAGALEALRKGIGKEDIVRTVRFFRNNQKLKPSIGSFGFFLSPPGESFWGLLKTLLLHAWVRWMLRGRGGSFVHWIRIEPQTEVYRIALENGVLKPDTKLLPDNAAGLKDVFYRHPPLKYLDFALVALHRSFWKRRFQTSKRSKSKHHRR